MDDEIDIVVDFQDNIDGDVNDSNLYQDVSSIDTGDSRSGNNSNSFFLCDWEIIRIENYQGKDISAC